MEKEKTLKLYSNGFSLRAHNRNMEVEELDNGDFFIQFIRFDDKNAEKPAVRHKCFKGKVRVSEIKLTAEGLNDFVFGYSEYMKNK